MSAKKYTVPAVDGFTEEQVMETLKEQGELEQYAVEVDEPEPTNPAPEEAVPEESDPAPVPPKEDVTDEPEPEEGDKLPKTIPYERFQEAIRKAREKEAEYSRQLEEYRKQQAEILKAQQEIMRKQFEASQPKAEPVDEDPLDILIRSKVEQATKPLRERIEGQQRAEAMQRRITESEQAVKARFRDYDDVAGPVVDRMKQAAQAAQAGDENAANWLKSIIMDDNPPLKAYTIGLWERANSQGIPPQSPTIAPPPKQGNTPPALPRGPQVGGSNTPDTSADMQRVVNMPMNEFAEWAKKNPAQYRRYLRGEI